MKKTVYIFLILAIPVSVNAYAFTRTLNVGSSGQDVFELQKFLNSSSTTQIAVSGVGSPGNETSFFGSKTKQAVIVLQNFFSDQILKPVGLTTGSGFVGKSTLAFLNSRQNSISTNTIQNTTTNAPVIESVSPTNITDGQTITIIGKNFSKKNTIILGFESKDAYKNIESTNNGTKIEFKYDSSIQNTYDQKYSDISKEAKARVLAQFPKIPVAISVISDTGVQSNFKISNFTLK